MFVPAFLGVFLTTCLQGEPRPIAVLVQPPAGLADQFGEWAVAMSNKRLIVGAHLANKVFVFAETPDGEWIHESTVTPPGGETNVSFGLGADINGDRLLVGAPEFGPQNPFGFFVGRAFLFSRIGDGWEWTGDIYSPETPYTAIGRSVALSSVRAIVRAQTGVHWSYQIGAAGGLEPESVYFPPQDGPQFGGPYVLDTDNDNVVFTFLSASGNGQNAGLGTFENGIWELNTNLGMPSFGGGPNRPVAMWNDRFVVAGLSDVHIFRRGVADWKLAETIVGQGQFGFAVGLSGSYLAVGAPGLQSVFMYQLLGDLAVPLFQVTVPEQNFGAHLALDGDRLAVVTPYSGGGGIVRIYRVESDCDQDGTTDLEAIAKGSVADCDHDGAPDSCQISAGDPDCDRDGVLDQCELAAASETDFDNDGTIDRCQCLADVDGSGVVTGADLAFILATWGTAGALVPAADIDRSGLVDGVDLALLLGAWGPCPE